MKTTSSETSTSYVFSWPGSRMCTWGRLRADSHAASSLRSATRSRFLRSLILPSRVLAALVETSPSTTPVTTWMRLWRARSVRAPRRAAAFIFFGVRCE